MSKMEKDMIRLSVIATCTAFSCSVFAQDAGPTATPLLKSDITGVENHEALMTHVSLPPNATLPMHYHPTEEFMYVISGEAILRIKGKEDTVIHAGKAGKIPAGETHTAITRDKAATVVVFRVHPKGEPVRIIPNNENR